jgi:4-amino-4-deoxy-L-arabinose transferase-like glycosyltransferase
MSTVAKATRVPAEWSAVRQRSIAVWAGVILLTAVGAYLRFANLGALGFRWDEDLSSLAVKAILEKGIPELPSGMIYLRGGAFLYLEAWSAALFGFSELALRVPAALFGIGLIPLAFAFGRALFSARVGLVAAGLITISIWDVEFARYARFYAPFAFFYVSTVLAIWRYRVQAESSRGGWLCIALALIAVTLHDLGYTLTIAFLAPLVLEPRRALREPRRLVFPLGAALGVGAFFLLWRRWLDDLRELPIAAVAARGGEALAPVAPTAEPASWLDSALGQVPLAGALWQQAPLLWLVLAALLLAAASWIARRPGATAVERTLLIAVAAACSLQLFNIALLALLALAFGKQAGVRGFAHLDVRRAACLAGMAFIAWLAASVWLDLLGLASQGAGTAVKQSIRTLLDFPHFFIFWGYPNEWPFVSFVAGVGALVAFDRAARPAPDRAAVFLAFVLVSPLVANGLFETLYELFRYNVPLNTFFFTLVALGLLHWPELIASVRAERRAAPAKLRKPMLATGSALLAALVLAYDLNPVRPWLAVQRDYREDGALYRLFAMQRYPDFKSAGGYVAANAAPEDLIFALDPREQFNYIGRLDYSVMSGAYDMSTYVDAGVRRDLYIGTPLVTSLDELRAALSIPGKRKWLIADHSMLDSASVDAPIRGFIQGQGERVVYVARDGTQHVYRFDP